MFRPSSFGFIALLLLTLSPVRGLAENVAVVDNLGGQPVFEDEFTFYASQLKTRIGGSQLDEHLLRAETLRAIAHNRALQNLASANGLIDSMRSYGEIVQDFHSENRRRAEMKEQGKVFYGPVRFRQDVWFRVQFEQLTRMLVRNEELALGNDIPRGEREIQARKAIDEKIASAVVQILKQSSIEPPPETQT